MVIRFIFHFNIVFFSRGRTERQEKIYKVLTFIWKHTFAKIGEDWAFLALLGIIMAVLSFIMDYTIAMCNHARHWLVEDLVENVYLQFAAWVSQKSPKIFGSRMNQKYLEGESPCLVDPLQCRLCPLGRASGHRVGDSRDESYFERSRAQRISHFQVSII